MTDRKTVLAVIVGLTAVVMTSILGIILLAFTDHKVPETLGAVAIGGFGALAAVLASTRSSPPSDPI